MKAIVVTDRAVGTDGMKLAERPQGTAQFLVAMDEPERRGIDAVAQATAISGAIREDVAEMAVAVG